MDDLVIDLKYNKGFSWYKINGFYFKGYLFQENEYIEGIEAIDYIKEQVYQNNDFTNAVSSLNGVFSLVYKRNDQIFICCDRMRTFPLFYSRNKAKLIISDDPEVCSKDKNNINELSSKEFLHTGYVTGEYTLLNDVYQVQAGELLTYEDRKFNSIIYHEYILKKDPDEIKRRTGVLLTGVLADISERLVNSLKGKTPIIPLSGGYDSRLIAIMLKNFGVKNAICFTYGRKGNPEVRISKKVAKLLGYKWYFIEYNEKLIKDYITTDEFKEYYSYSANYTSMFYMQEYFAVKELQKKIPKNSVFIPGHSGDFFAGSHLDKKIIKSRSASKILEQILDKHYTLKKLSRKTKHLLFDKISENVLKYMKGINYTYFENWDLKERQAKFIVNSSRIYEYFGFEHRLPLMDNDLMDYFIKLNPKQKLNKALYDKVLTSKFFNQHILNFEKETQATKSDMNIQKLKETMKKIVPPKIINKYKYKVNKLGDTYYYIEITDYMTKELISNGINIDESGRDKNSIIVQWYLYKIGEKI